MSNLFNPIFDLLAGLLSWYFSLIPSYTFAIVALTVTVLLVFAPLTFKSTKSTLEMRRVQPQVKHIQKKYKDDRQRMNQEVMKLYQEHGVSPLSGCLPILVQSPVFLIMYRVIRGITRRYSDIGLHVGDGMLAAAKANTGYGTEHVAPVFDARTFNPDHLDTSSNLYQSLIGKSEMLSLGVDLARTPMEVFRISGVGSALPYLAMIGLVAFLSWYQQHMMESRMTGEVSDQQRMIMKVMPWMLPIFSFSMPAALVVYFIASALIRIGIQFYLHRTVYADDALTTPIEVPELDDDDDDDDDSDKEEAPKSFMDSLKSASERPSEPTSEQRHGSRRPTNSKNSKRSRPARKPTSTSSRRTTPKASSTPSGEKKGVWGRAKAAAESSKEAKTPEKPVSRRVTPKGSGAKKRK